MNLKEQSRLMRMCCFKSIALFWKPICTSWNGSEKRKKKSLVWPGSSLHTVGFLPCCSTLCQPVECDTIYTGNNCHGTSCSRPRLPVLTAPQVCGRSHTLLHQTETTFVKWHVCSQWKLFTPKLEAWIGGDVGLPLFSLLVSWTFLSSEWVSVFWLYPVEGEVGFSFKHKA